MNKRNHTTRLRDKHNLETRLERKHYTDQPDPMLKNENIVYQIAERTRAIGCGGIGALDKMVCMLKLDREINQALELLRFHGPYHEPDPVLDIAYNVLSGGICLEDIERPARYEVKTEEREFDTICLKSEQVAEFDHRPACCKKTYRRVVVRKNLSVEKGERRLFDDERYFFYISNDREKTGVEIVFFANDRCNQENVIGQLKNGVGAMRMPPDGLVSNWAYEVIAALAWNLMACCGLLTRSKTARRDILRMEFNRFLISFVQIPCQVVHTGRRSVYRILCYSRHLKTFFATLDYIKRLKLA